MGTNQAWWSKSIDKGFKKGSDYFDKYSPKVLPTVKAAGDPWKAAGKVVVNHPFSQGVGRQVRRVGDVVTRGAGGVRRTINTISKTSAARTTGGLLKNAGKAVTRAMGHKATRLSGLALGVAAMVGIGVMKGAMNESRNIVYERYMQDMTYSRSMVGQSRVGLAHGTHNMLNNNGTQGLSNSLSATRHGRY